MSMIVHASMFVDAFVQWGRPCSGATRHGGEPSSFHWIVLTRIPGGLCPSDWDVLRYPWRGQLPGFGPLVFSSGLWNLVGIMTHRLLWTFLHVHILGLLRAALWIRARSALQSCSCAPGRTFRLTVHLESSWALKSHQVTRLHACRSLPDGIILCKQFSLDFDWSHNSEIANKSILSTSENEMMENSSANFQPISPISSYFPAIFQLISGIFLSQLPANSFPRWLRRGWLLVFLTWRAHERKGDARFVPWSFGRLGDI